jgi:hypothetical protein
LECHAIGEPLSEALLPGQGPALLLSEADRSEGRRGGSPGQCSSWRGSSCGPRIRWQRAIAQGRAAANGSGRGRGDWWHRDLSDRHEPLILSCLVVCSLECLGAGGLVATVDDVDVAVVAGLSHPMGPLRLSDLIGLDTLKLIADKMYEEFKEPLYSPPPLLLRMVEAGRLGKKSGRGFYTY